MSDAKKDDHGHEVKKDDHGHDKKDSPVSKVWKFVGMFIAIGVAFIVLVNVAQTFFPMILDSIGAGMNDTGNAMKRVGAVLDRMPSGLQDISTWLSEMTITVTRLLFPFLVVALIGKYAYDQYKKDKDGGGGHH